MRIITISSEIAPFSKSGGLADVTRSLSKALKRLGNTVIAITPLYGKIIDKEKHNLELVYKNIKVKLDVEIFGKKFVLTELDIAKYFTKSMKIDGPQSVNNTIEYHQILE